MGPMELKILPTPNGKFEIWLDETKIHHVANYKLESSTNGKCAELTLKILVKYPIEKESIA